MKIFYILLIIAAVIILIMLYLSIKTGLNIFLNANFSNIKMFLEFQDMKFNYSNTDYKQINIKEKIIIILRGHIRNSFENNELYYMLKQLTKIYDIEIYIHTWHLFSSGKSYRKIKDDNRHVTLKIIKKYFKCIYNHIKHIIIEDDKNIKLHGDCSGTICKTKMNKKGWKNMWYGKYNIINYVKDDNKDNNIVINMRFDILTMTNTINLNTDLVIKFIFKVLNVNKRVSKMHFLSNKEICGIDNIYMSRIDKMHNLISRFHHNLDDILKNENECKIQTQEFLVYREAKNMLLL